MSEPSPPKARGWSALLFDLDGTLADTVELILRCYRHTMRVHRGTELADDRWLATLGTPLREQLRDFARSDDEARAMLDTYVTYQREIHDDAVRAFPGAAETLQRFAEAGVALAVVTSKRREMAIRTLEACGLLEHFPVVVAADDVRSGKPDPEPVRKALSGLGVGDGARSLFVGDSPYDIHAGRDAGTRTAAALWGPFSRSILEEAGPDYMVERISAVGDLTPP